MCCACGAGAGRAHLPWWGVRRAAQAPVSHGPPRIDHRQHAGLVAGRDGHADGGQCASCSAFTNLPAPRTLPGVVATPGRVRVMGSLQQTRPAPSQVTDLIQLAATLKTAAATPGQLVQVVLAWKCIEYTGAKVRSSGSPPQRPQRARASNCEQQQQQQRQRQRWRRRRRQCQWQWQWRLLLTPGVRAAAGRRAGRKLQRGEPRPKQIPPRCATKEMTCR